MNRILSAIITLAALFQPAVALTQESSRGIEITRKDPGTVLQELYGKSWAVVVGVNHYPHGGNKFPNLSYAIADAKRVSAKLEKLGFEVRMLLDQEATRGNIVQVLADEIGKKAQEDDRIIFFFAGHGATVEKADKKSYMGYILPYDYDPDRHTTTAISMQQLRDISSVIEAKHMLYAMDSCFSGGILTGRGQVPTSQTAGYQYLKNLTQNRAHVVITAGGKDQTVKEEGGSGIFTKVFLDALSKEYNMPWSSVGYLTAMDLASYVQKRVPDLAPNQTPGYGHIDGEGDVVLSIFKPIEASTGERPVVLSPDAEERLRRLEHFLQQDREAEHQRRAQHERELASEREKTRLAEERRRAAEEARIKAEEKAQRKGKNGNGKTFVPPAF